VVADDPGVLNHVLRVKHMAAESSSTPRLISKSTSPDLLRQGARHDLHQRIEPANDIVWGWTSQKPPATAASGVEAILPVSSFSFPSRASNRAAGLRF